MGVPQNGWFIVENPVRIWMIWGYPPISGNLQLNLINSCVVNPIINSKITILTMFMGCKTITSVSSAPFFEPRLLKAFELTHGTHSGGHHVVHIELHHFFPLYGA